LAKQFFIGLSHFYFVHLVIKMFEQEFYKKGQIFSLIFLLFTPWVRIRIRIRIWIRIQSGSTTLVLIERRRCFYHQRKSINFIFWSRQILSFL
jgi:hypothetical protein